MPVIPTYPGLYIEEVPSGVRPIAGVSTADTAFVDFFRRGEMNKAVRVASFGDFEREFGGLDGRSEASYALQQYFLNGGQVAWVVRVAGGTPRAASLTLRTGGATPQDTLTVTAINEGVWGESLQVAVDYTTRDQTAFPDEFNVAVRETPLAQGRRQVVASEVHRNLSMSRNSPRYVVAAVNSASALVRLSQVGTAARPASTGTDVTAAAVLADPDSTAFSFVRNTTTPAADGAAPDANALRAGVRALDKIEPFLFNLLCLPAAANLDAAGASLATPNLTSVVTDAAEYCRGKRAFLLVDVPEFVDTTAKMVTWLAANNVRHRNAAVFFPRLKVPDALNENRPRNAGASGTLAGVFARTDAERGVWKAPAGTEAALRNASLAVPLGDPDSAVLNPLGANALRNFPVFGTVCWGARTLDGADQQASEWKYVPVRRTALYIEESLFQGLKWVVFEPNDEPLWAQIRLNVGAFLQDLFRQGAFQGKTPREAYFVKCDRETTTPSDVNRGIVNIVVGFAPLKPAEFVIIKIQQMAGQSQS